MKHSSEHRLIFRTIEDIQDQYNAAGATSPLQSSLQTAPSTDRTVRYEYYGNNVPTNTLGQMPSPTYVDTTPYALGQQAGMKDERTLGLDVASRANTPAQQGADQFGQFSAAVDQQNYVAGGSQGPAPAPYTVASGLPPGYKEDTSQLDAAKTVYSAGSGQNSLYDAKSGTTVNIPSGQIAQSAYDRLTSSGMSPQEAAAKLNDPSYKQGIQQASNTYGSSAETLPDISSVKGYVKRTGYDQQGNIHEYYSEDPGATAQAQQAEMQRRTQQQQNDLTKQGQEKKRSDESAASAGAEQKNNKPANPDTVINDSAMTAAIGSALQDIPGGELIQQSLLQSLQAYRGAEQAASDVAGMQLDTAKQSDMDTQAFIDKWAQKYKESKDDYADIATDVRDDMDKRLADQQERDLNKIAWQADMAKQQAEKMKTEEIDKMSISLALAGGFGSRAGLDQIASAEREWNSNIMNLQKEYAFKNADVSAMYTEKYVDLQNNYRLDVFNAHKEHDQKIEGLAQQGFASTQARKQAEGKALEGLVANLSTIRMQKADKIGQISKDVMGVINQSRDDKRSQEQQGWNRLENAIQTYGSFVPPSLLDSIGKQLPGVNVSGVTQPRTLAQMKQFKMKSMGGGGGGGPGGGVAGTASANPVADGLYSNLNPQELREAVDRVTRKFGGTGEERNRKRAEYLNRIASGESPASIVSSMRTDYWATQEGAEHTAHRARIDAISNADALQSIVNSYGITGDEDGSLGQWDSRVEWAMSFFGASSDEYNNLANYVGNIRAKIVKENYGAAVTPQELELAKSYVPDMTNKGPQFLTNIHNLKAYNAYLDAKQFADNVGLPPPKPPVPVSISGSQMSGPGKYSPADINSALLD